MEKKKKKYRITTYYTSDSDVSLFGKSVSLHLLEESDLDSFIERLEATVEKKKLKLAGARLKLAAKKKLDIQMHGNPATYPKDEEFIEGVDKEVRTMNFVTDKLLAYRNKYFRQVRMTRGSAIRLFQSLDDPEISQAVKEGFAFENYRHLKHYRERKLHQMCDVEKYLESKEKNDKEPIQ